MKAFQTLCAVALFALGAQGTVAHAASSAASQSDASALSIETTAHSLQTGAEAANQLGSVMPTVPDGGVDVQIVPGTQSAMLSPFGAEAEDGEGEAQPESGSTWLPLLIA